MVSLNSETTRRAASRVVFGALVVSLSACQAPHPGSNAPALRDPYEKFNRSMYGFNKGLDRIALKPATNVYRFVIPKIARRGITNIFNNLEEPLSFVNAILQAKPKVAWHAFKRFTVNTTIGIGGLFDHATKMGIPQQSEDFGQTLAVWGVKSGPFLMLPFFGPSTFRDAGGTGVDFVSDPVPYARNAIFHPTFVAKAAQFTVQTLNLRSKLIDAGADGVLSSSLDEYATVRSAYLQRRQSQIYDGAPPEDDDDAPVADAPLAPGATPPDRATSGTAVPSPAAPSTTGATGSEAKTPDATIVPQAPDTGTPAPEAEPRSRPGRRAAVDAAAAVIRLAAIAAIVLLAGCDTGSPKAPSTSDAAIAAAERKAVSDTDAALAEASAAAARTNAAEAQAAAPLPAGTKGEDDRFPR